MTKERIRAPKRIKGTRDVVVKVHALGLVHSKISSQKKKIAMKNVHDSWMNDAKLCYPSQPKYEYGVTSHCHAIDFTT